MGFFADLFEGKERKRVRLAENKTRGRWAERIQEANWSLCGDVYKRAPHGQDYVVRERTGWNTYSPEKRVEIKSSRTAPMSRLQKKTQKKGNYEVIRPLDLWG